MIFGNRASHPGNAFPAPGDFAATTGFAAPAVGVPPADFVGPLPTPIVIDGSEAVVWLPLDGGGVNDSDERSTSEREALGDRRGAVAGARNPPTDEPEGPPELLPGPLR